MVVERTAEQGLDDSRMVQWVVSAYWMATPHVHYTHLHPFRTYFSKDF